MERHTGGARCWPLTLDMVEDLISDPELNAELSGFIAKPFRFEDFENRFSAARSAYRRENSP